MLLAHAPEFVTAAEDFCARVTYMPASALGTGPELDPATGALGVRPDRLAPRWVVVPLLHALAERGDGLVAGVRDAGPARHRLLRRHRPPPRHPARPGPR
jgi:hypothetical protein